MTVTAAERQHEVSVAIDGYSPVGRTFGTITEARGVNQDKAKEALKLGAQCMREMGLKPMVNAPEPPGPRVSPVTGLTLSTISGDVLFAQTTAETAEGFAFELRTRFAELGLPLSVGWGYVEGTRDTIPFAEAATVA